MKLKLNKIEENSALMQKMVETIEKAEDKNAAVVDAINMAVENQYADVIAQITAEAERAEFDAEYRKQLRLPVLSAAEKEFVQMVKTDPRQAVTAAQKDVFPTETINRVMEDVRKASPLLSLVSYAPAGVKKWITASHSGTAVWGAITAAIAGELTANIASVDFELGMLSAYLPIPKAIRELADEFVMRYLIEILSEAMIDGLEAGYLNGTGKDAPIGIFKQIGSVNNDGTHKDKTVLANITKLSPKGLAGVRKTLTNNGKRIVSELALVCNPLDEAEYVDPALYGERPEGGYKDVSFLPIKKYVSTNCPQGKAAFTLPNHFVMGIRNVRVDDYKETGALQNVDYLIATAYANGRADDDNCAVVFDVTKLEEYVPQVSVKGTVNTKEQAE